MATVDGGITKKNFKQILSQKGAEARDKMKEKGKSTGGMPQMNRGSRRPPRRPSRRPTPMGKPTVAADDNVIKEEL